MTQMIKPPMAGQAEIFGRHGYAVLPLHRPFGGLCTCVHPDCTSIGKHPRTLNGVHDATTDVTQIREYFQRWPYSNVGIATGSRSGISVVDVDGPDGQKALMTLIGQGKLPPLSCKVITGRGEHYYFRTGSTVVKTRKLGPQLDLRGDGAYVVSLTSRHQHGTFYKPAVYKTLIPADVPQWLSGSFEGDDRKQDYQPDRAVPAQSYVEAAIQDELQRLRQVRQGGRNTALNLSSFKIGQLVDAETFDLEAVRADLLQAALAIGLGRHEAVATIKSGLDAGLGSPRAIERRAVETQLVRSDLQQAVDDPLAKELAELGETDADNAERLSRRYVDSLVCTPGAGYRVYDGKRWRQDDQLRRVSLAEASARAIRHEAAYLDNSVRLQRIKFEARSLSRGALDRALEVAKPRLMKADEAFDADGFALNVENGTINLKTGHLRPHCEADLITKIAPVTFDPDAQCSAFEAFLWTALGGDEAVIKFVQKAAGYTLTGATGEQVFFFLFGPGATGKSTLINVLSDALGDYATNTPSETLTAKHFDNGIPADIARLRGARLVTAVEINWSKQIDEAKIKGMTGGDPMTARFLHQNYFDFKPAFKLWMAANDRPGVRGTAEAFWRRVRLIPFDVVVPPEERDGNFAQKLKAERSGILAWAVRGCLMWQREGLKPPEAVLRGTADWYEKADHLRRFCNEELIHDDRDQIPSSNLYNHYKAWCERHGETPLDNKKFKAALMGRDFTFKRMNSGSMWVGIKVRTHH